jgi:hypothetical protein
MSARSKFTRAFSVITGADKIPTLVGLVAKPASAAGEGLRNSLRGAFRRPRRDLPGIEERIPDPKERFVEVARLRGFDAGQLQHACARTQSLGVVSFVAMIAAAWYTGWVANQVAGATGIPPIVALFLTAQLPLLLGLNAIKYAFWNWQLRRRSLDGFGDFWEASFSEWIPRRIPDTKTSQRKA